MGAFSSKPSRKNSRVPPGPHGSDSPHMCREEEPQTNVSERYGALPRANTGQQQLAGAVALCLSGQLRQFDLPCTGHALVHNAILPLSTDVFAFLNVPHSGALSREAALQQVHNVLAPARHLIRALEVETTLAARPELATCRDARGGNNGYPQSVGFLRCAQAALPQQRYDWMLRVRPDLSIPFVLAPPLPRLLLAYAPAGVAIVATIAEMIAPTGGCGCGYEHRIRKGVFTPGCDHGPCDARNTTCGCVSDIFAMVNGRHAVRAYFEGYAQDFASCARQNFTCRACQQARTHPVPECKLGASLAHRGVLVRDLRFATAPSRAPWTVSIVRDDGKCPGTSRPGNGSAGVRASHGGNSSAGTASPWRLKARTLQAIPPGPWDMRARTLACAPHGERPRGWEALCGGGV